MKISSKCCDAARPDKEPSGLALYEAKPSVQYQPNKSTLSGHVV